MSGASAVNVRAQTAASTASTGLATVISTDGVNLRASPTSSSAILQVLTFDSVVILTGSPTADGWYPATIGGQSGWIDGAYLATGTLDANTAAGAAPLTQSGAVSTLSAIAHSGASTLAAPTSGNAPGLLANVSPSVQSETMTASYYGIDDGTVPGTMMACGAPFDPYNVHNASTNDFSCGTKLQVTAPNGRQLDIVVTDHGAYRQHWMDLTYAAFGTLADHRQGVIQVSVKVEP